MNRYQERQQRKVRNKSKVKGNGLRPRLVVFRSGRHIYAQIIDDEKGVTLISASDLKLKKSGKLVEVSEKVGSELGKKAVLKKIKKVVEITAEANLLMISKILGIN